jgi:hypothetical protein
MILGRVANPDGSNFRKGQVAAVACVAPILECIRKMRPEGLADNEIAGLFRHAADELDEAAMREDRKIIPAV